MAGRSRGIAQCGACTVLVDGVITRSCVTTCASVASGAAVSTLDGLVSHPGQPQETVHPLQAAFIAEQAAQCAFCANGMIMGAKGWLDRRAANGQPGVPSDDEVRQFLSGKSAESAFVYICRCGAHTRIVRAIQRGAAAMASKRVSQGATA